MRNPLSTTPTFVGGLSLFRKVCSVALLVLFGSVLLNCNTATAQTPTMAHRPVGSWQATFNVPAFGAPITLLFSFFNEGIVIETDTPTAGPLFGPPWLLPTDMAPGSRQEKGQPILFITRRSTQGVAAKLHPLDRPQQPGR